MIVGIGEQRQGERENEQVGEWKGVEEGEQGEAEGEMALAQHTQNLPLHHTVPTGHPDHQPTHPLPTQLHYTRGFCSL